MTGHASPIGPVGPTGPARSANYGLPESVAAFDALLDAGALYADLPSPMLADSPADSPTLPSAISPISPVLLRKRWIDFCDRHFGSFAAMGVFVRIETIAQTQGRTQGPFTGPRAGAAGTPSSPRVTGVMGRWLNPLPSLEPCSQTVTFTPLAEMDVSRANVVAMMVERDKVRRARNARAEHAEFTQDPHDQRLIPNELRLFPGHDVTFVFPDGTDALDATPADFAQQVRYVFGDRARVLAHTGEDKHTVPCLRYLPNTCVSSPLASAASAQPMSHPADGPPYMIVRVDERWIIDPWIRVGCANEMQQIVYDIWDDDDVRKLTSMYGVERNWTALRAPIGLTNEAYAFEARRALFQMLRLGSAMSGGMADVQASQRLAQLIYVAFSMCRADVEYARELARCLGLLNGHIAAAGVEPLRVLQMHAAAIAESCASPQ